MHPDTKRDPCWPHGALHPKVALRPAKTIDSGSRSPGYFPLSESRGSEQNKHVFFHWAVGRASNKRTKASSWPQQGQPSASEAPPTVPSMTPQSVSTTKTLMDSPEPAVPRATGFLRAHSTRQKSPGEATKTTHLIYATTWAKRTPSTAPARALKLISRAATLASCRRCVTLAYSMRRQAHKNNGHDAQASCSPRTTQTKNSARRSARSLNTLKGRC